MPNTNEGTPEVLDQDPQVDGSPEEGAPDAAAAAQPDEVTTLRSRNQGLDRKVTTLSTQLEQERARAAAAEEKLNEFLQGATATSEDMEKMFNDLTARLQAAEAKAKTTELGIKYPEAYAEMGDAIMSLDEARLEAIEARLKGVPAPISESDPPKPVGNAAARKPDVAPKDTASMTLDEYKDWMRTQFAGLTGADLVQSE